MRHLTWSILSDTDKSRVHFEVMYYIVDVTSLTSDDNQIFISIIEPLDQQF